MASTNKRPQSKKIQTNTTTNENEPPCICLRPTHFVFCQSCGAVFKGRCRKKCVKHPRTIYLMDNDVCVTCKKSEYLLEIN